MINENTILREIEIEKYRPKFKKIKICEESDWTSEIWDKQIASFLYCMHVFFYFYFWTLPGCKKCCAHSVIKKK